MLLRRSVLERIKAGHVTVAFRRWTRPTVKTGGRLRTAVGDLAIVDIRIVSDREIGEADVLAAGFTDRAALFRELDKRGPGPIHRIALRFLAEDGRRTLAQQQELSDTELARLVGDLGHLDRGRTAGSPWTQAILTLIAAHPGRRAADLAAQCSMDTPRFKRRVRQLKDLGLTESLEVGYRLSPRGIRALDHLSPRSPDQR